MGTKIEEKCGDISQKQEMNKIAQFSPAVELKLDCNTSLKLKTENSFEQMILITFNDAFCKCTNGEKAYIFTQDYRNEN